MELKGAKILFLGDSITAGAGVTHDTRFSALIERDYGAACLNYGIGGTCIARDEETDEAHPDFVSRIDGMEENADAVVVFGGTNDFGHGSAPLGTAKDRTPDTFYGALHCLYAGLIKKYPCVPIIVLTPTHRHNEDNPCGDRKPAPVGTLADYVKIIREVAEYYSLPVIDMFAESGLQTRIPEAARMLIPDGLHPSEKGHEILARKIAMYLKNNI